MNLPPGVEVRKQRLIGGADDTNYRLFVDGACIREQLSPFGEQEIPGHVAAWKQAQAETPEQRRDRLAHSYERATGKKAAGFEVSLDLTKRRSK